MTRPTLAPAGPEPESDDPGAARLEELWREHADRVFFAAQRVTGSPADAEDVLQTVFLRLLRRDEPLDHRAGAFLRRAAVNGALDVVRRRHRAGWVPLDASPARTDAVDGLPDPERAQELRELRDHLRLALARLSPRAAEIFALRYFEGLQNREIAELLEVSSGVVAVLLHRTRARLRKELALLSGGDA